MSNYRYSEYKMEDVRQEKIADWWAESVRRRKNVCRDFIVETDNIGDWIVVGLRLVAQKERQSKENQRGTSIIRNVCES